MYVMNIYSFIYNGNVTRSQQLIEYVDVCIFHLEYTRKSVTKQVKLCLPTSAYKKLSELRLKELMTNVFILDAIHHC